MGGMGLTSEGVAIIHVSDINNHAPQFSPASVSFRQQHLGYILFSLKHFSPTACATCEPFNLCVARAVQNDSSGEQEGLWDWPCECDGQRRPWNRKLGSQVLHNQWPQRQLQNQHRPRHQPGGSDRSEGTVCWAVTCSWRLQLFSLLVILGLDDDGVFIAISP